MDRVPDISSIKEARENIASYIHRTPLIHSNSFSRMFDARVYIKAENLQKTGSFKVRGAFNKLIKIRSERIIAASMGNHAQGVAFAGNVLGKKTTIVMPVNAPIIKQEAARGYGAEVILYGERFSDALEYAISQKEYTFIHAFDDIDIISGQGTIGLELFDEIDSVDTVIVPVGGGGLISGISIAIKNISPRTEVIGVQTVKARSAHDSFHSKRIIERIPEVTIADGIAVGKIGEINFEIMKRFVDDILLVREESIAMAILLFLERKKLVVEGAGATGLGLLIENRERFKGKKIVILASGGNIDFTLIDRIIHTGLVTTERIGILKVIIDDTPLSLSKLALIISQERANIMNITYERFSEGISPGKTMVNMVLEIRNNEHLLRIKENLLKAGFSFIEESKK